MSFFCLLFYFNVITIIKSLKTNYTILRGPINNIIILSITVHRTSPQCMRHRKRNAIMWNVHNVFIALSIYCRVRVSGSVLMRTHTHDASRFEFKMWKNWKRKTKMYCRCWSALSSGVCEWRNRAPQYQFRLHYMLIKKRFKRCAFFVKCVLQLLSNYSPCRALTAHTRWTKWLRRNP